MPWTAFLLGALAQVTKGELRWAPVDEEYAISFVFRGNFAKYLTSEGGDRLEPRGEGEAEHFRVSSLEQEVKCPSCTSSCSRDPVLMQCCSMLS